MCKPVNFAPPQILHVAIQTAKAAAATVPAGDAGAAPDDASTAADAQVQAD